MPKPSRDEVARVVEALEDEIIFGRLRPLQELAEDPLMERFGAKRHVVRSALAELLALGIVTKPAHRSARVRDFSAREVEELYAMRALLQREAALVMPLPVDPADVERLERGHALHAEAARAGADLRAVHRLNDAFHDALFGLCRNGVLIEAIRRYTAATNPIRSYGIADPAWLERAVGEHAAMIACLREGRREALAALVVAHMLPTRDRWLQARSRFEGSADTDR